MKPPAPNPVRGLSTAKEASTAATAASTALPPSRRISAPASAVRGCPAATTPVMGRGGLAGKELGDIERAQLARLLVARRTAATGIRGAADRRLRGPARCRAPIEAGGDNGDPDLVAQVLVDVGA